MLVRVQPEQPILRARVAQSPERSASNAEDGGGSPSASANVPGCNVSSRRPGSEPGGRRCESCHPDHFWKAGRYKLAAPVSKTGSASAEVGALPTPSAIWPSAMTTRYLNPNERKTMFKPVNRSQSQLLPRRSYKPCPERSRRANRFIRIRFAPERNLLFRPLRAGPPIKFYECSTT